MRLNNFLPLVLYPIFITAKRCIMPKNSTLNGDDTPAILSASSSCLTNSTIVFSAGQTYNLLTPLSFTNLNNVDLLFEGNVSLPSDVSVVEAVVGNPKIYSGRWITVKGKDVRFAGSGKEDGGWFEGHGEQWWSMAGNDNNTYRPHFFSFSVTNLKIENIKVLKPVAWVFSIGGSNVEMRNTFIDARSSDGFPFNTDGIDLSASNVLIDTFEIHNGDDMINVSPSASNVTVRNIIASGTHGVSASCSSGSGGNYLFENALIYDSLMGARFKGVLGTTCNMTNVTWRNFEMRNVSYPIHFTETYQDQEKPVTGAATRIAAFTKGFTWENITGTTADVIGDGSCVTDPCWYASLDQNPDKGLYLLCQDHAHCQDFHFSGIDLRTSSGKPASEECTGLNGITGMGITCTNSTITRD
ncbi:pectin lyase-like protein [Mollisia scopiformis]|uniref:Pectin lyase-like protein n=1 Tax=Mollisia scopiformis TaxID=149040 RepID=A0A132BE49_MOLSC|nr:pectin lyase-like protein [Mollisia scopiformis]KUJ10523.1 pectin lyase-like protein [Mollisia scopiformis]